MKSKTIKTGDYDKALAKCKKNYQELSQEPSLPFSICHEIGVEIDGRVHYDTVTAKSAGLFEACHHNIDKVVDAYLYQAMGKNTAKSRIIKLLYQ